MIIVETDARPDVHDIGSALTTAALDGLQLSSELGAQDFEDVSVRVLVDEGPVKVEDDELFAGGHGGMILYDRGRRVYEYKTGRLVKY